MAESKGPSPTNPLPPAAPSAESPQPAAIVNTPAAAPGGLARFNPLRWIQRDTLESSLARGQQLIDRHSYLQAQSVFQEVLRKDEACLPALRGLGTALMLQGGRSNLLAAQAQLQEVAQQNPHDLPVCVALAGIYDRLGRGDEADRERRKGALLKRLQQEPGNPAANNNLGILFAQQRQWQAALACFRQALEDNPQLGVAWRNLAATCYHLATAEQRADARAAHIAAGLAAVEQAMAPGANVPSLLTLALLKSLGGDNQAAADVLAQAQALAPENRDVYAVMRTVLERAGMFDEALKADEIYSELSLD